MTDLKDKLRAAQGILEMAIEEYRPKHIFCLLSGGHDSMSCTHASARALGNRLTGVVHVNTGIGIAQTRQYVRDQCASYGWNFLEYKASENTNAKGEPDPMNYEDIVMEHGFPGAFGHSMMYSRLKERQIRRLGRDFEGTTDEPIMLVSGCRREESSRRMGTTTEIAKAGRFLWTNPFADMTGLDVTNYMEREAIKRNEVKDLIHMSGECLCGAFAHPGELKEIELWFPEDAANIRRIEAKVLANGFPWGWEEQPPEWWTKRKAAAKSGQVDAFEEEAVAAIQYLCVGCGKRDEAA